MTYFVITVDDDGDVRVSAHSEEDLASRRDDLPPEDALRTDLSERDPMYWAEKQTLIIKGEIVSRYPSAGH